MGSPLQSWSMGGLLLAIYECLLLSLGPLLSREGNGDPMLVLGTP